jgi:hypothetical protein
MGNGDSDFTIDRISFQLGMINCFAEMVSCGVKKLAISPPLAPQDYDQIKKFSDDIVKGFGIQSYLEKSLLITDLQAEEFTRGKWSILYYKDNDVLHSYLAIKEKKKKLEENGELDSKAQKEISLQFMRLLSYSDSAIEEKLAKEKPESPYMLIND